jgi:hypothetical protein
MWVFGLFDLLLIPMLIWGSTRAAIPIRGNPALTERINHFREMVRPAWRLNRALGFLMMTAALLNALLFFVSWLGSGRSLVWVDLLTPLICALLVLLGAGIFTWTAAMIDNGGRALDMVFYFLYCSASALIMFFILLAGMFGVIGVLLQRTKLSDLASVLGMAGFGAVGMALTIWAIVATSSMISKAHMASQLSSVAPRQ